MVAFKRARGIVGLAFIGCLLASTLAHLQVVSSSSSTKAITSFFDQLPSTMTVDLPSTITIDIPSTSPTSTPSSSSTYLPSPITTNPACAATNPIRPANCGPILLPPKPTHHPAAPPLDPSPTPLSCPWKDSKLRPFEVWSNHTLPPGCSRPMFYECTEDWKTYTSPCQSNPHTKGCKKLKKHDPSKNCPTGDKRLTPKWLDHLGGHFSQKGCMWDRSLLMGMVWSRPTVAPGCSEPVLWECTVDWQRWYYEGKDVPEHKWKRPGYCFVGGRGKVEGHDEASDMGCGYGFEKEGCFEKFLNSAV